MNWSDIERQGIQIAELKGCEYSEPGASKTQLRRLAYDVGVDRLELCEMDEDALLVERPDSRFTIMLNRGQVKVRHRFSMAHELSHRLLVTILGEKAIHRRRFAPKQDPEGQKIEKLCNSMASSILMPRDRVIRVIDNTGWSAACVPMLANTFDVSFEAAARRYITTTPDPSALLLWRPQNGSGVKPLQRPVFNELTKAIGIQLQLSSADGKSAVTRAFDTDSLVVSMESIVLWIGKRYRESPRYFSNAKVESFGRGPARFRKIFSVVSLPV